MKKKQTIKKKKPNKQPKKDQSTKGEFLLHKFFGEGGTGKIPE